MRHDEFKSVVFLQISLGTLLLGLFVGSTAFAQTSFFQGENRHYSRE
jgi:hypothetical protein